MIELFNPSWRLVKPLAIASIGLVAAALFTAQGILAQECPSGCPDPYYGQQLTPTTIADTMDLASRNQLGADGPTYPQIKTGWPAVNSQPYVVPAVLLKAIGATESLEHSWYQFDVPDYGYWGWTVIEYNENGTCDVGLMQLNSASMDYYGVDRCDAAESYAYNIGGGARILISKWNERSNLNYHVGENNPAIAEDWYYAVWAYNKWTQDNNPANYDEDRPPYRTGNYENYEYPYQEMVWGWAAHPPDYVGELFWDPVDLTLPDPGQFQPWQDPPAVLQRPSPSHVDPHGSTFLPNVRVYRGGGDQSIISVHNASGDYTAVNITLYDQYGDPWGSDDRVLAANASWFADTRDIADTSIYSLYGSAIVAASPDVDVTIHRVAFDLTAYEGVAGTQRTGVTGFRQAATTLYAPTIYRYYSDWNTSITVQNAGPVPTTATITFHWFNGNTVPEEATQTAQIQPGASKTFNQQGNTWLPIGFDGVAEITADQPLTAVVIQEVSSYGLYGRSAYNAFAYGSTPDPQTLDQLNIPLFFHDLSGYNSSIEMMNIGQSAATAEMEYTYVENCYQTWYESQSLGPGEKVTFDGGPAGLPSQFLGVARVGPQGSDFVAVVNARQYSQSQFSAYEGFDVASASMLSYAPFVKRGQSGDGIMVMNTSMTTSAKVKVYFFDEDGVIVQTIVDWICPENSSNFYLPAIAGLPSNYQGSAKIVSQTWWSPPPPVDMPEIAAVVNRISDDILGYDNLASYGCFNR